MLNLNESKLSENARKILLYTKAEYGLHQQDLANIINSSGQSVAKIEAGDKAMNLAEYFYLCDYLKLEHDTAMKGYVDLEASRENGHFYLPDSFKKDQYSYGKIVRLYVNFFKKSLGEEAFNHFCKSMDVDPIYFFNISNPINMSFILKMAQHLISKGILNSFDKIKYFAKTVDDDNGYEDKLRNLTNPFVNLENLSETLSAYEKNHEYKIDEIDKKNSSFKFSLRPNDHLDKRFWSNDPVAGGFIENLVRFSIPLVMGFKHFDTSLIRRYGLGNEEWTTINVVVNK